MKLSSSPLCRWLRGSLRVAPGLSLLALAGHALAVMPEIRRLVPKSVPAFAEVGDARRVALGAGLVAAGVPALVNPKTGVATGGVLLWDARTGRELPPVFPPPGASEAGMSFGESIAMSGSTLVVGAVDMGTTPGAADSAGGAFVLDAKTRRFLTAQPLRLPVPAADDSLGAAVAVDGDVVAVGSSFARGQGTNAAVRTGAVLVVNVRTGEFTLVTPDAVGLPGAVVGAQGDLFGVGLALRGRTLVVGAPLATVSGQATAGRIYVVSANLGPAGGTGGVSVPLAELTEPVPAAGMRFGQRIALGSRYLVTGVPSRSADRGEVGIFDARELPALPFVTGFTGPSPGDEAGLGVATEGNRVFFSFNGRFVFGVTPNSPFSRNQTFFTWDSVEVDIGDSVVVAEERLAVGQRLYDGPVQDSGAVVLMPTTTLHMPDFYPGPLIGDPAPDLQGDVRLTGLKEVVTSLRAPPNFPSGNPLFVAGLSAGVAGVKGPVGLFEHNTQFSMMQALAQSTAALPVLSRPVANHVSAAWFLAGPKGKGLPNLLAGLPAVPVLRDAAGALLGPGLPLKSAGELRVDNGTANRGLVPVLLTPNGGSVLPGNDSGLLQVAAENPGTNAFFKREGTDLGSGLLLGEVAQRGALLSGLRSYAAGLTGTGVTAGNNQLVEAGNLFARKGDTAPETRDAAGAPVAAQFALFTGETHDSLANGLIRAVVSGPGVTAAVNEGLWSNRTGDLRLILQKGQQAPLMAAGVKVKRLLSYGMVGADVILIHALVGGPGVNAGNDGVLYLSRTGVAEPGQFEVLAREGDRVPALGGAKVAVILRVEATSGPLFTDRCRYGVLCSLATEPGRVTPKDNLAWLVGAPDLGSLLQTAARLPLPKVRKGEYCEVFGPGYDRVTSLSFLALTRDATGALHTGMAQVLDYRHGGSVPVVTYPNRRQAAVQLW